MTGKLFYHTNVHFKSRCKNMMDNRGKTVDKGHNAKKHIMSRINLVHVTNVSVRQRGE